MDEIQFLDEIEALVTNLSNVKLEKIEDIAVVVYTAMEFMKLYKELHGLSKRQIVVEALKQIVDRQSRLGQSAKGALLLAIDTIAPPIIDMIYRASVEGIKFNPKNSSCCISLPRER